MTEQMPEIPALNPPVPLDPANNYSFVTLIDNVVYGKIKTDAQQASILAAGPSYVQVPSVDGIEPGDVYDPETGEFSRPL